jgi:hypothetical protein
MASAISREYFFTSLGIDESYKWGISSGSIIRENDAYHVQEMLVIARHDGYFAQSSFNSTEPGGLDHGAGHRIKNEGQCGQVLGGVDAKRPALVHVKLQK